MNFYLKKQKLFHFMSLPIEYTFDSLKTEIISILMYYIIVAFYIFIFGSIIQNLRPNDENYIAFFIPGLMVLTIIGSITSITLKFWFSASVYKLMSYWLTLPLSIRYLLFFFTFNTLIKSILYSFPLLVALIYLRHSLESIFIIILLLLVASAFLYYILFILLLELFNTDYFYIIQQTSQPLLTRISPVFYKIIFIPIAVLPLVYINPFTWVLMGMRNPELGAYVVVMLFFLNLILFELVIMYWKKKNCEGSLIK